MLLLAFSSITLAQSGPLSFGITMGAAVYKGDLTDHNANPWLPFSKDSHLAVGGFFAKEVGPASIRFQMNIGGLQGSDYRNDQRFNTNFYEYNAIVALNINHLINFKNYTNQGYNVYVLGGYGMMRYSSYLTDYNQTAQITDVGYAAIARATSIIAGAGVKVEIVEKLNFLGEFTYHMGGGESGDQFDAVIDNGDNDSYYYISLGLSYDILGSASGKKSSYRKSLRWGRF